MLSSIDLHFGLDPADGLVIVSTTLVVGGDHTPNTPWDWQSGLPPQTPWHHPWPFLGKYGSPMDGLGTGIKGHTRCNFAYIVE